MIKTNQRKTTGALPKQCSVIATKRWVTQMENVPNVQDQTWSQNCFVLCTTNLITFILP